MKKILLIGDSIRKGYDKYVKYALKDTCDVYFPKDNCRFAANVLRHLHDWKSELELDNVDVVHFNAGLWDTLELFGDGPFTPIEFYAYYIDKICNRIKLLFPGAKVIFATSTPVLEHRFNRERFFRSNAVTRKYNEVAVEIVKKHGFFVNDLYSVAEKLPEECYSDMTHLYTPDGTYALTNAVLKAVSEALDLEYKEFKLENYTEVQDIIGM